MAGSQNNTPARDDGYQNIMFLRRRITFDGNSGTYPYASGAFKLGTIPAGAVIIAPISGIDTITVFNAGTANTFSLGISGTAAKYGSALTAATVGFAPMAVAVGHRVSVDTDIYVTPTVTGTAPTTGEVEAILAFIPAN